MAQASISAKIKGDATDFKQALNESQTAAQNWASRMATTRDRVARDFARPIGGAGGAGFLGGAFSMASIGRVTAGLGAVAAAGYSVGKAFTWADNLRDMSDGLEMVGKDAESVALQLDHLLMLSKQPNVDFFMAAEASKKLRAIGYTAEQTRTIILSLANALAATGEADESLLAAVEALSKIASKGEISERMFVSLVELAPKVRDAFKNMGVETAQDVEKLGTDVKQIVASLVTELQKIPATAADAGDKVRFQKNYARYLRDLAAMKAENLLVSPGDTDSATAQRARALRLTAPPADQSAAEAKKQEALRNSNALKEHELNVERRKADLEKATAAEQARAAADAEKRAGRIRTITDPDELAQRRFGRSTELRKQYGTYERYLQRDPELGSMSMGAGWKGQFGGLDAFNRFKGDSSWGRVSTRQQAEVKAHEERIVKAQPIESAELQAYKAATKAFEKAVELLTPASDKAKSSPVPRSPN
jgi:hypothetical protein